MSLLRGLHSEKLSPHQYDRVISKDNHKDDNDSENHVVAHWTVDLIEIHSCILTVPTCPKAGLSFTTVFPLECPLSLGTSSA